MKELACIIGIVLAGLAFVFAYRRWTATPGEFARQTINHQVEELERLFPLPGDLP